MISPRALPRNIRRRDSEDAGQDKEAGSNTDGTLQTRSPDERCSRYSTACYFGDTVNDTINHFEKATAKMTIRELQEKVRDALRARAHPLSEANAEQCIHLRQGFHLRQGYGGRVGGLKAAMTPSMKGKLRPSCSPAFAADHARSASRPEFSNSGSLPCERTI